MRITAVTSGKGGVGKTNLSANLGIALADLDRSVLLFDADIGLANLDLVLGCPSSIKLQHVVRGDTTLASAIQSGPGGVKFIAGGSGIESLFQMEDRILDRFLSEVQDLELQFDDLILDTGSGIDDNVLTFLCAADETLLVVTPDPASMADSYAIAKALWLRRPDANVRVVMNMVENEAEGRLVFARINAVAQEFLGRALRYAGCVRHDREAVFHIRARRPFLLADPTLAASKDVRNIARLLAGHPVESTQRSLADRLRDILALRLLRAA
ncbi:MAG: MinD/ParA family protein [Fimbriimonas ginsengisoli]|uniref:MinD/ParA family protein n=1 Tax=Fimbriimonas ginsengisoli TaxID=1005039 RepID=A0A931PUB3_FIMGI|nr:MinD/ParA family protein [Fimbriimonas ginsengisoli]